MLDARPGRRVALALLVCAALAGCGGGDEPASKGSDAQADRGRELFRQRCGGCHTLAAAGTQGSASNPNDRERIDGPNLDNRRVTEEDVLFAIRNGGFGGSVMPANIVSGEDARAVARFVARNAGAQAPDDVTARLSDPVAAQLTAAPAGEAAGTVSRTVSPADQGFLRAAFDSAQKLWDGKFTAAGARYAPAHLVFFHSVIDTPCGRQTAATGPFYCPANHGVYLNTDFFAALAARHGIQGPFAAGYVTAHEVGHHVQQLLGLHRRVAAANAQDPGGANPRSVRVELQADCYAGVWLHWVARAGEVSQADVRDILTAAAVVGDDFQRNQAGAELAPETWTHGSSEQRVHWVSTGKASGLPADCDTFG